MSPPNLMLFPHVTRQVKWYFGEGQSLTGHSPTGGMLDRGRTYDNNDQFRDQKIEHGMKRQEEVKAGKLPMSFKGEPQITARPTCETRPAPSSGVNDEELLKFARVSSGMVRLARVMPVGPLALQACYGEGSEDWTLKGFTHGGLYPHIKSGQELMRRVLEHNAKKGGKLKLAPAAMLQNEFRRASDYGSTERLIEFGAAHGDAVRLLGKVCEMWNDLHRGESNG